MKKVLVVDDDQTVVRLLEGRLGTEGFEVIGIHASATDSVDQLEARVKDALADDVAVAVCDLTLPIDATRSSVMTGLSLLKFIREINKRVKIIVLTGTIQEEAKAPLEKFGVSQVYLKSETDAYDNIIADVKSFCS